MGRRGRRLALWTLSAALSTAAVLTAVLLLTLDRLPAVLSALVVRFAPAFELDVGDARFQGWSGLDLQWVVVRLRGETTPVFTADRVELRFTPNGLRRAHVDAIRLVAPVLDVPATLPDLGGGDGDGTSAWSVGRLVADAGWLRVAPSGERPGARADVALDLRDLGTVPEIAERRHRVHLRHVEIGHPDRPPLLATDAAIVRFSMAGIAAQRLDELRLVQPVVTVPETLPAPAAGGDDGPPSAWRLGRLVVPEGEVRAVPTAARPGATLRFHVDLRELGLGPDLATRRHRIGLRNLAVRLADDRAPSLVVDAARVDFTLGGVLDGRRVDRVRVAGGTIVLDAATRARLTGGAGGAGSGGGGPEWRLGRVDVVDLGVRLGDLGLDVPDVTLLVRTVLHDVPLGAEGLARATEPQRIELADLSLYSPLDPFRRVIRVASIFVEFTLADLVRERIEAVTLVSPTIYVGEDLIWYMNAERAAAPSTDDGGGAGQWTVRRVRAELGRVVVTFEGADRLQLPIAFRTTARDVNLADLATLRIGAELQVPKQSYRFPGFDLDLQDVEGALRFDYPPGRRRDNLVNVLRAAEIRWGDYRINDAWLSVTFDQSGINGRLGGAAYDGYTTAGLSVPFSAGDRSAWIAGERVDLAPLTTQVSNGHATMTGHATFEGALTIRDDRIHTASGRLTLLGPGRLDFPDLDTLPDRLPADAPSWQRDLARIAGDVFRDWPWTSGDGTLALADHRGTAALAVRGDRGTRRIEAHYYQDPPLVVPMLADATTAP